MKHSSEKLIIGIDPDVDKNGIAVVRPSSKTVQLHSKTLSETIDMIEELRSEDMTIVVEAGWMNKSNYHLSQYDTRHSAAKKGVDQGRNHQRGIDIVELLQHRGFRVIQMKPLALIWGQGLTRKKVSDKELRAFMIIDKKRTNQEERDAALLAWAYAGLPMCIRNSDK